MKMRADHYGLVRLGLEGLIRQHGLSTVNRVFANHNENYGSVGATNSLYNSIRSFIDKGLTTQAEKDGVDSSILIVPVHEQLRDYHDSHINTAVKKMMKEVNL